MFFFLIAAARSTVTVYANVGWHRCACAQRVTAKVALTRDITGRNYIYSQLNIQYFLFLDLALMTMRMRYIVV